MNYRQLKSDARASVANAQPSPHGVTCKFWLVILVVIALGEYASFSMETSTSAVSGISALAVRNSSTMLLLAVSFAVQLLTTVWSAVYTNYALALSRGEEGAGFEKIVQGFTRFFSIMLLLIVEYILIVMWTFLFIIPGLIAAYRYRFSLQILLENPGISPMEAISRSSKLTQGYKMQVFILDIHLLWYQILASVGTLIFMAYSYEQLPIAYTTQNTYVFMGITYLFSMFVDIVFLPFYHTTIANAYHWIQKQKSDE